MLKEGLTLTCKQQVGQMIFFGFDGCSINEHVLHALHEEHIGNVILFARNFENSAQLSHLIQELQVEAMKANGIPLFVAIDHEGGSVNRLTRDFTWFPGTMATHAAGSPSLAFEIGSAMGKELAACGINLNLAPVVDLADNPDSMHIGSRSYGASPDAIKPYAVSFIRGLQNYLPAAAKHFPSIGNSSVDLHLALGQNTGSLEHLEAHELLPIKNAVEANVNMVMTSHEIYPALDNCPGTLSYRLITEYLRGRYHFQGLVISDCMEMKALCQVIPTPEACVRACLAGVDLFLICHTEETQAASSDALVKAVGEGRISGQRLSESLHRILEAKKSLIPALPVSENDLLQHRRLASHICENALTLQGNPDFMIPEEGESFLLLAPPPATTTMLDETAGASTMIDAVLSAFPASVCIQYSFPMTEQEYHVIQSEIEKPQYRKIYFALYQAHQDNLQRLAIQNALQGKTPVGAIILRSPYDLRWCEKAQTSLLLYDYIPPMIAALLRFMKGELAADGQLPIPLTYVTDCTPPIPGEEERKYEQYGC